MIAGQYINRAYNGALNAGIMAAENAAIANNMGYGPNGLSYAPLAANAIANGLAYGTLPANGIANNLAYDVALEANQVRGLTSGGGFRVTSSSPMAASGITVRSENLLIEGPLAVSGQMPFTGVVALEGPLPAAGQGSVAYGCGNGNVGILSEGVEPGYVNGLGVEAALPGLGYNVNKAGYAALY